MTAGCAPLFSVRMGRSTLLVSNGTERTARSRQSNCSRIESGAARPSSRRRIAKLISAAALLRLAGRAVPTLLLQMSGRHSVISNRNREDMLPHLADCDGDPRRIEPRGIEPSVIANGVVPPVIEEQIR